MRKLVIGDVHGGYIALKQLINRVQHQPDDQFIFLGDYADGWSQTPEVIDFLIQFRSEYDCILLKGNHDALCEDFLLGKSMNELWFIHGGEATAKAYEIVFEERKRLHLDFLSSLELCHLDDENRLFVHAGFTNLRGVKDEHFQEMLYWDRTLWEEAIALPADAERDSIYFPKRLQLYKEIYIGHTPTTRYNSFEPMHSLDVWNVDTGGAFKGKITALDVETKEFWQSDPVYQLYPEEKGRN